MQSQLRLPFSTTHLVKYLLFAGVLSHSLYLLVALFSGALGANPVEALTHESGHFAFYFLIASLAVTPVRKLGKWPALARLRRTLGLWSFYYLSLHVLTYLVFDHFFFLSSIVDDVIKRPFITAGVISFLLLLPLAATSFNRAIRWLGKRWQLLHKAVYIAAVFAIVHYLWLVKADLTLPLVYGFCIAILLGLRFFWWVKK